MAEKPMTTLVSYKKTERWLYNKVESKGDKSNFIKDVLKEHFAREEEEAARASKNNNSNNPVIDIMI